MVLYCCSEYICIAVFCTALSCAQQTQAWDLALSYTVNEPQICSEALSITLAHNLDLIV